MSKPRDLTELIDGDPAYWLRWPKAPSQAANLYPRGRLYAVRVRWAFREFLKNIPIDRRDPAAIVCVLPRRAASYLKKLFPPGVPPPLLTASAALQSHCVFFLLDDVLAGLTPLPKEFEIWTNDPRKRGALLLRSEGRPRPFRRLTKTRPQLIEPD